MSSSEKRYHSLMLQKRNGRTIREFIRQLAFKNGYALDLQNIEPKQMLNACIKSVVNTTDLENLLLKCLTKIEDVY